LVKVIIKFPNNGSKYCSSNSWRREQTIALNFAPRLARMHIDYTCYWVQNKNPYHSGPDLVGYGKGLCINTPHINITGLVCLITVMRGLVWGQKQVLVMALGLRRGAT